MAMIKNSARKIWVSVFPWMGPLLLFSIVWSGSWAESGPWTRLDQGLYMGEFKPTKKSEICDRNITILKIDPKFFAFKLLCASEHDRKARTVREWATEFGLVAATNAGMYQGADFLKSTGFMKNYKHVNNPYFNRSFGAFLVFNPADPSLPEVQIIDRRLQKNWRSLIKRYNTVIQNYRM
ncbi:MAG: hypothetical protein PVG99_04010, partial [Desulfobacteraceae bacterium]